MQKFRLDCWEHHPTRPVVGDCPPSAAELSVAVLSVVVLVVQPSQDVLSGQLDRAFVGQSMGLDRGDQLILVLGFERAVAVLAGHGEAHSWSQRVVPL